MRLVRPRVGIDFGTSKCIVAYEIAEKFGTLVFKHDDRLPTVVSFPRGQGKPIVGEVHELFSNPARAVGSFKTCLGENRTLIEVDGEAYSAEEIAAVVFSYLKQQIDQSTIGVTDEVVVTVPAQWGIDECRSTEAAAKIAGFKNVMLVDEPTAALLWYVHQWKQDVTPDENVLVFDFGGGTLDVSIVRTQSGVVDLSSRFTRVKPLSLAGHRLGGSDVDRLVANRIKAEFQRVHGVPVTEADALGRILAKSEQLKIELSNRMEQLKGNAKATFKELFLVDDKGIEFELTANELVTLIEEPILSKLHIPVEEALTMARLQMSDIDKCILVGGSTKLAGVKARLEEMYNKQFERFEDPIRAVAFGAAVAHADLTNIPGKGQISGTISRIMGKGYGVRVMGDDDVVYDLLISEKAELPCSGECTYYTSQASPEISFQLYTGRDDDFKEKAQERSHFTPISSRKMKFGKRLPPNTELRVYYEVDANKVVNLNLSVRDGDRFRPLDFVTIEGGSISSAEIEEKSRKIAKLF